MNGFNLVSWKKRSKAAKSVVTAAMSAAVLGAEWTAKSAAVRGTAEGQSPGKGKVKSSGLDPSSGPWSIIGRAIKTWKFGKDLLNRFGQGRGVVGIIGGIGRSVETSAASMGLAGPAEGWPGISADSGRNSEGTRMAVGRNGSHNHKPGHHCGLSNEVKIWVKAEVKTGKTLDGTQVKREELNSWKTLKSLLDLRGNYCYCKMF